MSGRTVFSSASHHPDGVVLLQHGSWDLDDTLDLGALDVDPDITAEKKRSSTRNTFTVDRIRYREEHLGQSARSFDLPGQSRDHRVSHERSTIAEFERDLGLRVSLRILFVDDDPFQFGKWD